MAKNAGKVGGFCQSGKVGTLIIIPNVCRFSFYTTNKLFSFFDIVEVGRNRNINKIEQFIHWKK